MKASKEKVEQCVKLIEDTLPSFAISLAVGDMSPGSYALATESLLGCRDLILALQSKVEELEQG